MVAKKDPNNNKRISDYEIEVKKLKLALDWAINLISAFAPKKDAEMFIYKLKERIK